MPPDIFMTAGEISGDRLGGSILEAMIEQQKNLEVVGIGGPQMRAQGLFPTLPMEELQVMGFIDVIRHLPHLIKTFRRTMQTILHLNPKAVVTIDYPGFNLRLGRALRKHGYRGKLCHVVCPSVWAWGKNRIQLLEDNYDLLLTLLPFEKPYFHKAKLQRELQNSDLGQNHRIWPPKQVLQLPLQVGYIGHPLVQAISYETRPEEPLIAFFPGSRSHEIERNLPFYLRLIPKLKQLNPHLQFGISVAAEKYRPLIQKMTGSLPTTLLTPREIDERRPMMAIAKSGTITLELALRGIPTVVTYGMSPLDIALAKWVFRISLPYYALPNLILNFSLFPELIGTELTDKNLFDSVNSFLIAPQKRHQCHLDCQKVRQLLTTSENPSKSAASLILSLISS